MSPLSKASNVVQNVFFLYDGTGFTQIRHSIPVATTTYTFVAEAGPASTWRGGVVPRTQNPIRRIPVKFCRSVGD